MANMFKTLVVLRYFASSCKNIVYAETTCAIFYPELGTYRNECCTKVSGNPGKLLFCRENAQQQRKLFFS